MSTAQYSGRKFDLLAIRGATASGEVLLSQSLFGPTDGGDVCTGAQKVAQRWFLEFMTELGSMEFLETRGTDFMTRARTGGFVTEADVTAEFNFANAQAQQTLQNEEDDTMPNEDRFDTAILNQIVLQDGGIIMSASVFTLAGTSRAVILPIGIVPANIGS